MTIYKILPTIICCLTALAFSGCASLETIGPFQIQRGDEIILYTKTKDELKMHVSEVDATMVKGKVKLLKGDETAYPSESEEIKFNDIDKIQKKIKTSEKDRSDWSETEEFIYIVVPSIIGLIIGFGLIM